MRVAEEMRSSCSILHAALRRYDLVRVGWRSVSSRLQHSRANIGGRYDGCLRRAVPHCSSSLTWAFGLWLSSGFRRWVAIILSGHPCRRPVCSTHVLLLGAVTHR